MDPSATLLSILHKNPPSESSSLVGQISPPTPSYPSQPTPPLRQSSPNSSAFGFNQAFTQPTGYNSAVVFSSTTVPPPQAISPNPLGSLLNSFSNTQISSPVPTLPISDIGVSQIQSPLNPQNGEPDSVATADQTLKIEDSIKLVLFGHASSTQNIDESQQEDVQPEASMTSTNSVEEEDVYSPEDTSEIELSSSLEVEEIDYNNLSILDSTKPPVSTPASKHSPTSTSKSVFTYSNPFDLLKNSPPPSPNRDPVIHHRHSSPPQRKGESYSVHKDGTKSQLQKEYTYYPIPELSAWNVRESILSRIQSSNNVSDGVRLPRGIIMYHTGERNEKVLSSKDLKLTPITLIPLDHEYRIGKLIAVNGCHICYAIKGGKIRVLDTKYGCKVMLRNHEKSILDVCIQEMSHDEHQTRKQLILAVGADNKITVSELFPSVPDAEIPYKVILSIDAKEAYEDSRQPRYHRAIWHPLNYNLFAVATDTNDVLIFDINNILEGNETGNFKESEIAEKILKSEMHEKPINDLAFSPDGNILATASGDSVTFYTIDSSTGFNPVHKIILDGQLVSSILFVEGGHFTTEQSLSLKFRYVIIGTERNTILNLYDVESAEYIQSIKFLPPPERRPSLSKNNRKEEPMFNCVSFDQSTRTLIVANSVRVSIFAFHLNIPSRNFDKFDLFNQNNLAVGGKMDYESTSTPGYYSVTNSVQFNYMVEFPVNQLIWSFVTMSGTTSDGFSLYCAQPKSVQQYIIPKDMLLPQNIDACPEYVCAERVLDHQQPEVKDDVKKEENKNNFTETFEISSQVENLNQSSVEETITEKDISNESMVMDPLIVEGASEANIANPESDEATLIEKGNIIFGNMQDSTFVAEENANKGAENQKSQKIKSTGHLNGAVSKMKAKKANVVANASPAALGTDVLSDSEKTNNKKTRRGEKDSENIHSPEAPNKPTGKKPTDGSTKNNGKSGIGGTNNVAIKVPSGKHPMAKPPVDFIPPDKDIQVIGSGISSTQMRTIMGEIKKIEDSITNKLGKSFSKELEKQFQKIEDERVAHQAAETSRQETILKLVSQSLTTNTSKLLESTIRSEIQNSVLPALSKMVTSAVDKHAHRGISDAVNKSIPAAIEKCVAENVQRVLAKASVIESIAKGVSKAIRPVIEETFRENFTTVLIPSYQKATNAMFEQITATFEAGMQDIVIKSAQASSYTNIANVGDKNALARLQASVEHLTQQLHHLQASITRQGGQQLEQPINRTSDDYQNQLARSLTGELKRILIPQNSATNQQPSVSQPEPYGYLQSGRLPSSQQQQHPQQLFSPVEPQGLEDSDRSLESGNYEDAFVAVLSSHDLAHILRLCHKISPKVVFLPSRSLLSQPVILSIIHHLSLELNKYSELKLGWIEEAILKLNPKDHVVREHCEKLLPMVKQRLEQYYYMVSAQDPASPSLKNISLLIHVINGLLI